MTRPFADTVRRLRIETRAALALRRRTRRAVGRAFRIALHAHRGEVIEAVAARRRAFLIPAGDLPPDLLQLRVREIVERHPEGITIRDVGNELGVDWRHAVESLRVLTEAGIVEQVNEEYYAVRKASR
jgi:DNA-binding transcriptional ArsR family regulator